MGFDFRKDGFTPDNFELNPAQVMREVRDMQSGDVGFITIDDAWVDHERKMWLDFNAELIDEDDIEDLLDSKVELLRVLCVPEGIVVDGSHYEHYDYADSARRFTRFSIESATHDKSEDIVAKPVIYFAANTDELGLVAKALHRAGITLAATSIAHLVDLEAASVAEEDDPDDEEEEPGLI